MSQGPSLELSLTQTDPELLLRAVLSGGWVNRVTILTIDAHHDEQYNICRLTARADDAEAFQDLLQFSPALKTEVVRQLAAPGAQASSTFHGEFWMHDRAFQSLVTSARLMRSPWHIATFFNGTALREYTPEDIFEWMPP